jgi:hypothetical protein
MQASAVKRGQPTGSVSFALNVPLPARDRREGMSLVSDPSTYSWYHPSRMPVLFWGLVGGRGARCVWWQLSGPSRIRFA